jgi:hypothetical protein
LGCFLGRYRALIGLPISTVAGAALAHPDFPFNLPGRNTCRHLSCARYALDSSESMVIYARVARMNDEEKSAACVARWQHFVAERLGREPRGFRDVAAFNAEGLPASIRVSSIVDGKPFPTLYWLIDADLSLKIDRLEAGGWIARVQTEIASNAAFRQRMQRDHAAHIALRDGYLLDEERKLLESKNMLSALSKRGIGGISELDRIRCFHTWYAAHMVVPNCVGEIVDQLLADATPRALLPDSA